jgi:hypothetical protein
MIRFLNVCFLVLAVVSCGGSSRQCPIEYNDAIINEQFKVISLVLDMSNVAWKDIGYAMELREELEIQAKESHEKIKNIPPFGTDSRFRDTALKLFDFYVEVSSNQYVEMLEIIKNKGEKLTTQEMISLDSLVTEITQKEQILDGMFIRAQKDFARKNGLEIAESELQPRVDSL